MTTYEVTITQLEEYVLEVEAESSDTAIVKAWRLMESEGKEKFHNDSDAKSEAYRL